MGVLRHAILLRVRLRRGEGAVWRVRARLRTGPLLGILPLREILSLWESLPLLGERPLLGKLLVLTRTLRRCVLSHPSISFLCVSNHRR